MGRNGIRKEDPDHEIWQEVATMGGRERGAERHFWFAALAADGCGWLSFPTRMRGVIYKDEGTLSSEG